MEGVKWCFKPSQPLRIISKLKETFVNTVERINKTEIRSEEQSQKTESWENLWNEIQLKGP